MNKGYLDQFKLWMQKKALSKNTIRQYYYIVRKLDFDDLEDDMIELKDRVKGSTYNVHLDALGKFSLFLSEMIGPEHELIRIIDSFDRIKGNTKIPYHPYTVNEVKKILTVATGWRHQLLFIALHSGLRKTEIRELNVDDIDLVGGWIHVRSGKGNKRRRVAIAKTQPLVRWKKIHDLNEIHQDDIGLPWLFSARGTRPIVSSGSLFKQLNEQLGFRVQMHRCRATYATNLYRKTLDQVLVQKQLGHKSLQTTMQYIHQFDDERGLKIQEVGELY